MTTMTQMLNSRHTTEENRVLRNACREQAPVSLIVSALLIGIVLASTTFYLNAMDSGAAILLR